MGLLEPSSGRGAVGPVWEEVRWRWVAFQEKRGKRARFTGGSVQTCQKAATTGGWAPGNRPSCQVLATATRPHS